MNRSLEQFFSLLKAGLWKDALPDSELFDLEVGWKALFKLSVEQTVAGLVWSGIEKLPAEKQPPKEISIKWYSYVVRVEQTNAFINKQLAEVVDVYDKGRVTSLLLKGAGIAELYHNPKRRGCGDIDMYVGVEDFEKANELVVSELGGKVHSDDGEFEHDFHESFLLPNGITVENHHHFTSHFSPRAEHNFDRQFAEWFPNGVEKVRIGECSVSTPPLEFNVQYVFIHMYKHLFTLGVGMRQLCDCAVLLDRLNGKKLDLIGYSEGWKVACSIFVDYLGVDPAKVPDYNPKNRKRAKIFVDMVLSEGNFGMFVLKGRPKGYLQGKLFSLKQQLLRWPKLMMIAPSDTFNFILYKKMPEWTNRYLRSSRKKHK